MKTEPLPCFGEAGFMDPKPGMYKSLLNYTYGPLFKEIIFIPLVRKLSFSSMGLLVQCVDALNCLHLPGFSIVLPWNSQTI